MGEEKENIQEVETSQKKEIRVKKEDIIYALLCGVVVGLILMGSATIVNGWWTYVLNAISSGGYLVVAICLMLLTFYQKFFCEKNIERNKLPAKIVATIIYFAIAGFFIFVSWEGLLGKDFSGLTFWLVAISWALVSLLIIVKQISINKQDFDNSPLQSYAYILCGMIYVFAYAVIFKFNFDTALKIFYTIHTIVALTVFINIIFRYGIKASNFIQLALFIVSVITLMALLVSTLYFWFWDYSKPELFTAIMGIFAGLIGGVLTLTGVAWTIKKQDEARKIIEIETAKPYIKLYDKKDFIGTLELENYQILSKKEALEIYNKKTLYLMRISDFIITIPNRADCILCGAIINDVYVKFRNRKYVEKGEKYQIDLMVSNENTNNTKYYEYLHFNETNTTIKAIIDYTDIIDYKEIQNIQIVAKDTINNYYCYELLLEIQLKSDITESDKSCFITYGIKEIGLPILIAKEKLIEMEYKELIKD